jgi:glycosyltransferase involved in cell wall biosynthesis
MLRIFITADPELPVPPVLYGGIERVIALLADGLQRRGHDVTLFAHPDSNVSCRLVPYRGRRSQSRLDSIRNSALIAREALRRRPQVIHSFSRLSYLTPLMPFGVAKVMSYQREITRDSITRALKLARGRMTFVGCSRKLIQSVSGMGKWRVVYNAVPVDRYQFVPTQPEEAPFVFLGRIEQIKGTHLAIDLACQTGRRLIIAGNIPANAKEYYERDVLPWIDGRTISYVGEVNDEQKNELLGRAAALIMPVLWDEPFGIVMAEALACGTPVIGLNRGAVPEVVEDGRTGFVCEGLTQMAEAVERLGSISRARCRQAAEERFSESALVRAYEDVYGAAMNRQPALVGKRRAAVAE